MPAPNAADVVAFLQSQCGTVVAEADVAAQVTLALADAARVTGYSPVVGVSGTKSLAMRPRLALPTGLFGSITVTDQYGSTYSAETHYRLWPTEGGVSGSPYEWIQWLVAPTPRVLIQITGTWGLASDWPDDLKQAVINIAAARTLEAIRQGHIASEGVSWREADASRDYASGSSISSGKEEGGAGGALIAAANAVLSQYARAVIYG